MINDKPGDTFETPSQQNISANVKGLIKILVDHLQDDPLTPVREYISNAHDARDEARSPVIQVWTQQGKLFIRDNGHGMTRKVIMEAYTRIAGHFSNSEEKETIGMFGIGVLSAFISAGKLEVQTRHAEETHGWRLEWIRYADTFHLEPIELDEIGTLAILYLDENARESISNDKDIRRYVQNRFSLFTTPLYIGPDIAAGPVNPYSELVENLFAGPEKILNSAEIKSLMGEYFSQKLLCAYFGKGPGKARVLLAIPEEESQGTTFAHKVLFFSKGVKLTGEGSFRNFYPDNLSFVMGMIDSADFKIQISREEVLSRDDHFQAVKKSMESHILRFLNLLARDQPKVMEQVLRTHRTKLIAHGKECDDLCELFRDHYQFTTTSGMLRWREILPYAEQSSDERFIYYTSDELSALELLRGSKFMTVFTINEEIMVLKQIADCEMVGLKDVNTIISDSEEPEDVPEPFRRFLNNIIQFLGKRGIRTVVFVKRSDKKEIPAMFRISTAQTGQKDAGGNNKVGYNADALMLNIANPVIGKLAGQKSIGAKQLEKIADTIFQIAVLHSPFSDLKYSVSDMVIENLSECMEFRIGNTHRRTEYDDVLADCFVALPYRNEFDTVWNAASNVLKASPYNWNIIRGDRSIQHTTLLESIKKFIDSSHRFIADISGLNPNVLIEVGMMLESAPEGLLMMCDEETLKEMPVDLQGKLFFVYKSSLRQSEDDLTGFFRERIKAFDAWINYVGSNHK